MIRSSRRPGAISPVPGSPSGGVQTIATLTEAVLIGTLNGLANRRHPGFWERGGRADSGWGCVAFRAGSRPTSLCPERHQRRSKATIDVAEGEGFEPTRRVEARLAIFKTDQGTWL